MVEREREVKVVDNGAWAVRLRGCELAWLWLLWLCMLAVHWLAVADLGRDGDGDAGAGEELWAGAHAVAELCGAKNRISAVRERERGRERG